MELYVIIHLCIKPLFILLSFNILGLKVVALAASFIFSLLPLQPKSQNFNTMDQPVNLFHPIKAANVDLYHRDEVYQNRVMNGKALYNQSQNHLSFVENPPRKNRSKLILASGHASLRRRTNGSFSINIVFEKDEKYVKEALISEVRGLVNAASTFIDEPEKTPLQDSKNPSPSSNEQKNE